MTDKEYKELIESEQVIGYIEIVKKYCDFIENRKKYSSEEFLKNGLDLLVDLYQKTLHLKINYPDKEDIDIQEIELKEIFKEISLIIGEQNLYRSVFDPYEPETEGLVIGTLSDDFTDIYRDLKEAYIKFNVENRNAKLNALYDFVLNFRIHWGRHAVSAINVLHDCVIPKI